MASSVIGNVCKKEMTYNELSVIKTAGKLKKDCHYVITDYNQGTVGAATIQLHAINNNQLSMDAYVLTTHDTDNGWKGTYNFDDNSLIYLSDNQKEGGNHVYGESTILVFPWGNSNVRANYVKGNFVYNGGSVLNNVINDLSTLTTNDINAEVHFNTISNSSEVDVSGLFNNNVVSTDSTVLTSIGSVTERNKISNESKLENTGAIFRDNKIELESTVLVTDGTHEHNIYSTDVSYSQVGTQGYANESKFYNTIITNSLRISDSKIDNLNNFDTTNTLGGQISSSELENSNIIIGNSTSFIIQGSKVQQNSFISFDGNRLELVNSEIDSANFTLGANSRLEVNRSFIKNASQITLGNTSQLDIVNSSIKNNTSVSILNSSTTATEIRDTTISNGSTFLMNVGARRGIINSSKIVSSTIRLSHTGLINQSGQWQITDSTIKNLSQVLLDTINSFRIEKSTLDAGILNWNNVTGNFGIYGIDVIETIINNSTIETQDGFVRGFYNTRIENGSKVTIIGINGTVDVLRCIFSNQYFLTIDNVVNTDLIDVRGYGSLTRTITGTQTHTTLPFENFYIKDEVINTDNQNVEISDSTIVNILSNDSLDTNRTILIDNGRYEGQEVVLVMKLGSVEISETSSNFINTGLGTELSLGTTDVVTLYWDSGNWRIKALPVVGGTSSSTLTDVNFSEFGELLLTQTDIHLDGAGVTEQLVPFTFSTSSLEGSWVNIGNILTYNGSAKCIKFNWSIRAEDLGASNYWSNTILRITENVSGRIFYDRQLAMQDTNAYDGTVVFSGGFSHLNPPTNASYTLDWVTYENRTATLIPDINSQVTVEAVINKSVLTI